MKQTTKPFSLMQLAAVGVVSAITLGCTSKPVDTKAPNANTLFTFVSEHEIRAINGAHFENVLGPDGNILEIKIVSRDGTDGGSLPNCECEYSACSGSCKPNGTGQNATCDGSCFNSEQNACGSCKFATPPTPGGNDARTGVNPSRTKLPASTNP